MPTKKKATETSSVQDKAAPEEAARAPAEKDGVGFIKNKVNL
jgi:hypothetical protein